MYKIKNDLVADIKTEGARRNLMNFIQQLENKYLAGWFHRELTERLEVFYEQVQCQKSPRLILSVPPRHGKSTIVSKYFPAWCFGKSPDIQIISTSYAASLSSRFNREVQRAMDSEEYARIFPKTRLAIKGRDSYTRTSDHFEIVDHIGGYRSAGVGGGITGLGCDILICDDLVKDVESANSPLQRDATYEWFKSVAYTRLSTGGGVIVVMTRWHFDDIAGRLIAEGSADRGEYGDAWEVVSYPAIAESEEAYRGPGEALHPERFPLETLKRIQTSIGTNQWLALYQQQPVAIGGNIIQLGWFARYEEHPSSFTKISFSIDTAYKAKQISDYTVIQVWGSTKQGYFLLDTWRKQAIMPDIIKAVVMLASIWKPHEILIEDAASGQSLIQTLKQTTKLPVIPIKVDGDKVTRIYAEATAIEAGQVFIPKFAKWLPDFESELSMFPKGAHDDQVDALSQYLKKQRQSAKVYEYHAVSNSGGFGSEMSLWR